MTKRKIISISHHVLNGADTGGDWIDSFLIGLADDGTLWRLTDGIWEPEIDGPVPFADEKPNDDT